MNCATIHKKFFQQVTRPNCQTPGTPAQESFYIGDLDGIRLNVTHRFMNSDDWDKGDINDATALDTPFEIIMVDCFGVPYIEVGRRRFTQLQSRY